MRLRQGHVVMQSVSLCVLPRMSQERECLYVQVGEPNPLREDSQSRVDGSIGSQAGVPVHSKANAMLERETVFER